MSYLIFARKWRPMAFKDVVGQEHVTRTLANAITSSRIAHAYLFSGTRGCGKTTTARIMAKALNCENGPTAEPCNECTWCTDITKGKSLDVLEIDGASNRGIDEIRELREMVRYSSGSGKYKIYIIDEVHMLTNEAFNALLKTLEEPPDKVIFIFATTEPNKVPATILSRCQRFDFKRISAERIKETLARLGKEEKLTISEEALWLLARKADGSLRDALSLLDQTVAFCGDTIDEAGIGSMLGLVDRDLFFEICAVVLDKQPDKALELVDRIVDQGYDWSSFLEGLVEHLRNLLVIRVNPEAGEEADIPGNYRKQYADQAALTTETDLLGMIRTVSDTAYQIKRSAQPKFLMEMMMTRLVHHESSVSAEELLQRLDALKGLAGAAPAPAAPRPAVPKAGLAVRETRAAVPRPAPARSPKPVDDGPPPPPPPPDETLPALSRDNLMEYWQRVIVSVKDKKRALGTFLDEGAVSAFTDDTLTLTFNPAHRFHVEQIRTQRDLVEREMKTVMGTVVKLSCVINEDADPITPEGQQKKDRGKILESDPVTAEIARMFKGEIVE